MSYVKREDVVGKKVVTPDGNVFGTVKDLAFSMKGDVGLVLSTKNETEVTVSIRQASAIGEYILLSMVPTEGPIPPTQASPKGPPTPAAQGTCPSCGNPVKAGAKFCGKCGSKIV